MSEPRLPPDLRVGRFLLDNILRALGFGQWILSNVTYRSQLHDAPVITLPATSPNAGDHDEKLRKRAERQAQFDALVRQIEIRASWPSPILLPPSPAVTLTAAAYRALQNNPLIPGLAHLRCLPAGEARAHVAAQFNRAREKGTPSPAEWRKAETPVDAYIAASLRYTPWRLHPDGRLKKSAK